MSHPIRVIYVTSNSLSCSFSVSQACPKWGSRQKKIYGAESQQPIDYYVSQKYIYMAIRFVERIGRRLIFQLLLYEDGIRSIDHFGGS